MSSGTLLSRDAALGIAERLVDHIAAQCVHLDFAGALRRGCEAVRDIDVVAVPITEVRHERDLFGDIATSTTCDLVAERLDRLAAECVVTKRRRADGRLVWGPSWRSFAFEGIGVDLFTTEQGRYGWILALRTGPSAFSRQLVMPVGRTTADGRPGLLPPTIKPRDGWLTRGASGERIETPTEREVFDLFGLPYVEPGDRT